jgi:hypothetical protein
MHEIRMFSNKFMVFDTKNNQNNVSELTITQLLTKIIHLLHSNNSAVKIIIIQITDDYNALSRLESRLRFKPS